MDPLRRVRGKVERAKSQAASLSDELSAAVREEDRTYRLVPELDLDAGECRLRIQKVEDFPDPEWETVLGEILHDLRSALDQLATQLAILNGADEDTRRGCEFPIFLDRDLFYSRSKGGGMHKMRALAAIDQGVIESLQPFDFPEHPLWVLQQMSNGDKHRLGNDFADRIGLPMLSGPRWTDLERVGPERWEGLGSYKDGEVVVTYGVRQTGDNPKAEVHFRPTISITVDEGIGRPPRHIGQVLPELLRAVEKIVETFSPRFV